MSKPTSPSPRRPGAPPGNQNALKHGFYTRRLKKRDLTGVETTDVSSLVEEIALIRLFTRRLVESASPMPTPTSLPTSSASSAWPPAPSPASPAPNTSSPPATPVSTRISQKPSARSTSSSVQGRPPILRRPPLPLPHPYFP